MLTNAARSTSERFNLNAIKQDDMIKKIIGAYHEVGVAFEKFIVLQLLFEKIIVRLFGGFLTGQIIGNFENDGLKSEDVWKTYLMVGPSVATREANTLK